MNTPKHKWPNDNTNAAQGQTVDGPSQLQPEGLMPCPFCGSHEITVLRRSIGWRHNEGTRDHLVGVCGDCGAQGMAFGPLSVHNERTARKYWNHRTPAPVPEDRGTKERIVPGDKAYASVAEMMAADGTPQMIQDLVNLRSDLDAALRENAGLKARLLKWEGETHEGYTDSPAKVNESLRAQLTEMKKSAEADFEIYHQVRLALVAAGCNEFKLVPEMLAELVDKRDALQSANAVLRGALQFYADGRHFTSSDGIMFTTDFGDVAIKALQSPSPAMVPVEDVKGWTQDHPKESGLYWLWQGDEEQSPFPVTVMYSGTSGKCFVATGHCGWTRHQEFEELEGAWWMPCVEPKHPSLK